MTYLYISFSDKMNLSRDVIRISTIRIKHGEYDSRYIIPNWIDPIKTTEANERIVALHRPVSL